MSISHENQNGHFRRGAATLALGAVLLVALSQSQFGGAAAKADPPIAATAPAATAPVPTTAPVSAAPVAPSPARVTVEPAIDVHPAAFNEVQPGSTTQPALVKAWGEPIGSIPAGEGKLLTFKNPDFKKVEVQVDRDIVSSIIIHLEKPVAPSELTKLLGLDKFSSVVIPDPEGSILGEVFPERGVLFGYVPDVMPPQVAQLVLEMIRPESFVLRALHDFDHDYKQNLSDLEFALNKTPGDARAHWLKSKVLANIGRTAEAIVSANKAVELQADAVEFRLQRAKLLMQVGRFSEAAKDITSAQIDASTPSEFKALATQMEGDLAISGGKADFAEAMKRYQEAIKIATPLVGDKRFAVRRAAKAVLVESHLQIAQCVAWGQFQRKPEVVPMWLARATEFTKDLTEKDNGDITLRLLLYRKTLACYAAIAADPSETADTAMREARALIAASRDSQFQRRVEWELGIALADAAHAERARGKADLAVRHASSAAVLMEGAAKLRPAAHEQNFALGRVYFLNGSLLGVQQGKHAEAAYWYEKALPLLAQGPPPAQSDALGGVGEWLVSMGVSFWEAGQRDRGVHVTEHGVKMLQAAVDKGLARQQQLSIPYGNLAAMFHAVGDKSSSQKYGELASRLDPASAKPENKQR